jgi:uncharacterized protein
MNARPRISEGAAKRSGAVDRRAFLSGSAQIMGALGLAGVMQLMVTKTAQAGGPHVGYGPLAPVADDATGLSLLQLPQGFRYTSFSWRLDPMADGNTVPAAHDGMAVVDLIGGNNRGELIIVRNHEQRPNNSANVLNPAVDPAIVYNPHPGAVGSTSTLRFNSKNGLWIDDRLSIAGTITNCAGGVTPWGSWVTCEEQVIDIGGLPHGYAYEVPGLLPVHPVPLKDMGRFAHEALAIDARTSVAYQTEDTRFASGFYRFTPNVPFEPYGFEAGGKLEMLAVRGQPNANLQTAQMGQSFDVAWVEIDFPDTPLQTNVGPFVGLGGQTRTASGPFVQGYRKGGAQFRRLEGCWYDGGSFIYFADTEGGRASADTGDPEGTIWCYDIDNERITVIYESPAETLLDNPDNLTVSPSGNLLLCEDGDLSGQRLAGLTLDGVIFPFAVNNVVLSGERNGLTGDFRGAEWAGATFDPSGKWLFVNNFAPGITFAITGPWARGSL